MSSRRASPVAGSADARDIRLTMRDVILLRAGSGLQVTASHDAIYADNLDVSVAGVTMNFDPRLPVGRRPRRRSARSGS